jgi:hypothetical protein
MASEQYSFEAHFKNPAKTPAPIIAYLTKKVSLEQGDQCRAVKPNDIFETEIISLNKSSKAYLVKPADMCFCSASQCPMWMFQMKGKTPKLIWTTPAASALEILDKHLNGYRKLKEMGSEPARGHDAIWSWDKDKYTEIDKTVWTLDTVKNCRFTEQTSQLMDGKMVQHSVKCFQD